MDMHKCISKFNDPNECATNLDPYPFLLRKKERVNKCATIYNDIFGIFHQENDGKDMIFYPNDGEDIFTLLVSYEAFCLWIK